MASVTQEFVSPARPQAIWDALRDVGALHTRLVPGFVIDTKLVPAGRIVTFVSGAVVFEPIIDVNDETRRIAWASLGGSLTHYNASVQVFADGDGSRVVWIADFLPDQARDQIEKMVRMGMEAMKATFEKQENAKQR
jgi:carbon monoxide dehydrogenase subunit G